MMIPFGNGWFRIDLAGLVCLFDSIGLAKQYFVEGDPLPEPGSMPRADLPPVPPPTPGTVQAVVTARCNLSCRYCSVAGNPCVRGGPEDMSEATASRVLEACAGRPLLAVTGGEPLVAPDVTYRLLEGTRISKLLFTNGTLLDGDAAAILAGAGAMLIISMDGMTGAHDSMRRFPEGAGTWSRVAEGMARAGEAGLAFGISVVLREHNLAGIAEALSEMNAMFHPASFGLNLLHHTGTGFSSPDAGSYARAVLDAFYFAKREGVFVDQIARRLIPLITEKPRFRDCEAMGGKTVFFPDGSVSCCVNWLGRADPPPDWGRRIPVLSRECRSCPAICVCGGGCAWDGDNLEGPGRMDRRNCAWTLALLEEALVDIGRSAGAGRPSVDSMCRLYSHLLPSRGSLRSSVGHAS